jgi:two-component system chemotaxis response regulator CheY
MAHMDDLDKNSLTNPLKIMVVDDAPFIREIVKQILASEDGYVLVGEASNGLEAVERASELKPDIILMDIVMPEMSGIKATEEILKFDSKVKIIAFTTMDNSSLQKQAMQAGCRGFLKKPFSKNDFLFYLKKMEQ